MVKKISTKKELFDEIGKYISNPESIELIEKAYDYAQDKHKDQKRKSGEPYFVHVLNVAYELAKLRVDPNTICAGLMHDVIEDCGVSKEEFFPSATDLNPISISTDLLVTTRPTLSPYLLTTSSK